MSLSSRFKVKNIKWWNLPIPLYTKKDINNWVHIGYVWRQKAYCVNNISLGWIAFIEDQTEENLNKCPCCGGILKGGENG